MSFLVQTTSTAVVTTVKSLGHWNLMHTMQAKVLLANHEMLAVALVLHIRCVLFLSLTHEIVQWFLIL